MKKNPVDPSVYAEELLNMAVFVFLTSKTPVLPNSKAREPIFDFSRNRHVKGLKIDERYKMVAN